MEQSQSHLKVAALFDMDYTLLSGSSGLLYLRYLRQSGYLPWYQWLRVMQWVTQYVLGLTDFPRLMARLMTHAAGSNEEEAWRLSTEWFDAMLRGYVADGARERVQWHQSLGHHVAIVTAATPYVARHVAGELGLGNAYVATELEVVCGRFTGNVAGQPCYGSGKVTRAIAYASQQGLDLAASYFYSDSHHDLPLLEAVGHPVAVNPSRRLAQVATDRGWPVLRFY